MRDDPREIYARFDCVCKQTGEKIRKGELCVYYPRSKAVYSVNSKQAEEFRSWSFDLDMCGYSY